jgi:hypothetical protein
MRVGLGGGSRFFCAEGDGSGVCQVCVINEQRWCDHCGCQGADECQVIA